MKRTGIILMIIGAILMVLNFLTELATPMPLPPNGDNSTAYYIGYNFIAIIGFILLIVGMRLWRKSVRKDKKKLIEDLFKKDPNNNSN